MIRFSAPLIVLGVSLASCSSIPQKSEIDGFTIETKVVQPKPAVTTRKTVKLANLAAAFQVQIPKTFVYAQSNGGEFDGKPFAVYHSFSEDEVDVEVGCPLKAPILGKGDIHANPMPGGKVAMTSHFGPYQNLVKAHAAMDAWFEKHGAERNGPPWEIYVSDPTTTAPDKVRTDVFYPIK
jgi:effector-binding domain-containing protein